MNRPLQAGAREAIEAILAAVRQAISWTASVNEHHLWEDKQKRAAVERQFEVIAEALQRLQAIDENAWHHFEEAAEAIRFGEAIRRDFDDIDYGILWRATRKELPQLLTEAATLLAAKST